MKKKIILFYPKSDKINSNMHLPLSVLVIASDLLDSGYQVKIIDERTDPDYKRWLPGMLDETLIFGASVMTGYQIRGGLEASRFVKSMNRNIPIVWGGWHASILPAESLKNPYIDIAVIGSGEGVLPAICRTNIQTRLILSGINGLMYKDNGKIMQNNLEKDIDVVGSISKDAMELLNPDDYIQATELGRRSIFWITSRGCPFSCGFCCSVNVYKRRWISLAPERIISDLSWLTGDYGINGINFIDTNFFVDKKRVIDIMEGLIAKKINIQWVASVRVDQIKLFDKEFLKLLKISGCKKLFVGIESGSREVLELINKQIKIDDVFKIAEVLDKIGIIAEMYVMAGFPIDPLKDLNETLLLAKKIKQLYRNHQFTSLIYTPYPGTPLYDLAIRNGLKVPSRLEDWQDWNILQVRTPWINTRGYSDRFHSFIKMYYPLAYPSDMLKNKFKPFFKYGWIYWMLHKIGSARVRYNFFLFPVECWILKFINYLRVNYKILDKLSGFR